MDRVEAAIKQCNTNSLDHILRSVNNEDLKQIYIFAFHLLGDLQLAPQSLALAHFFMDHAVWKMHPEKSALRTACIVRLHMSIRDGNYYGRLEKSVQMETMTHDWSSDCLRPLSYYTTLPLLKRVHVTYDTSLAKLWFTLPEQMRLGILKPDLVTI